jgi:hypothetical protein
MAKKPKRPTDFMQRAKMIIDIATGGGEESKPKQLNKSKKKNLKK